MNLSSEILLKASVKSVTVLLQNDSSTTLILSAAVLSGGNWCENQPPVTGQSIISGQTFSAKNCAENNFDVLGGYLTFAPVSGGQIIVNWAWPINQGLFQYCTSSASNLQIQASIINGSTSTPTLYAIVTRV